MWIRMQMRCMGEMLHERKATRGDAFAGSGVTMHAFIPTRVAVVILRLQRTGQTHIA